MTDASTKNRTIHREGGDLMCLTRRAETAGILARAIAITLDTTDRTTHQMHSMQGRMRAELHEPKRKKNWKSHNF